MLAWPSNGDLKLRVELLGCDQLGQGLLLSPVNVTEHRHFERKNVNPVGKAFEKTVAPVRRRRREPRLPGLHGARLLSAALLFGAAESEVNRCELSEWKNSLRPV